MKLDCCKRRRHIHFSRQYYHHILGEWKQYYLDYNGLKDLLHEMFPREPRHSFSLLKKSHVTRRDAACPPSTSLDSIEVDRDRDRDRDRDDLFSSSASLLDAHTAHTHPLTASSSAGSSSAHTLNGVHHIAPGVDDLNEPFLPPSSSLSRLAESPPPGIESPEQRAFRIEQFRKALESEADKVDSFYHDMENKLSASYDALAAALERADARDQDTMDNLQQGITHLYRKLTMLFNFMSLNASGFSKIETKFRKRSGASELEMSPASPRLSHTYSALGYPLPRDSPLSDAPSLLASDPHDSAGAGAGGGVGALGKSCSGIINNRYFQTSTVVPKLLESTSTLYAKAFENGDSDRARVRLMARMSDQDFTKKDMFRLGFKVGLTLLLIGWNLFACLFPGEDADPDYRSSSIVPIYRCFGLFISFLWLWGLNVLLWSKYRVNYVYVFEFNPQTRLTHWQIFEEAASMSIVYLGNGLLYNYNIIPILARWTYPMALFVYCALKLLVPWEPFSNWKSRQVLLDSLAHIFRAPFGRVRFLDIYVADVLTSMPKVLVDLVNGFCYLSVHTFHNTPVSQEKCGDVQYWLVPLVCALPLWFRFQQCMSRYYERRKRFPDVANAGKYALAEVTVVMGAFHPLWTREAGAWDAFRVIWVVLCVASSLYSFFWDVVMDWGFIVRQPVTRKLELRRARMYPSVWVYYFAMASNLFLRFLWTLNIVPFTLADLLESLGRETFFVPFIYFLELCRRFQWGIFRVEHEHLSNMERFRGDAFVPIMLESLRDKEQPREGLSLNMGLLIEIILMVTLLVFFTVVLAMV